MISRQLWIDLVEKSWGMGIVAEGSLLGHRLDAFFICDKFSLMIHHGVWLELRFISQKKKTPPSRG